MSRPQVKGAGMTPDEAERHGRDKERDWWQSAIDRLSNSTVENRLARLIEWNDKRRAEEKQQEA